MTTNQNAPDPSRSRGREIALNVGAVAGLICVLAAAASFLFGIKPLVFRSGSMSPDIPTGALALSQATEAADLTVGDVVSVLDPQGTRITHRIQEIVSTDGTTSVLILKGDANKDADISPYTVTEVDRVFFSVPGLGYAVSWLSSPMAIFLGGGLVGAVMVLAFGPGSKRKDDNDSDSDSSGPGAHERIEQRTAPVFEDGPTQQFTMPKFQFRRVLSPRTGLALGAAGLVSLVGMTTGTAAAFTDTATAVSGSFASNSTLVPAPTYLGCTTDGSDVIIRWAHLGPGYTYEIKTVGGWYGTRPAPSPLPANKGDVISKRLDAYDDIYSTNKAVNVEIRSIRNGVTGTSYVGERVWAFTIWGIKCDGERSSASAPSGGGPSLLSARGMGGPDQAVAPTTPATTTSATSSASASATSTTSATTSPSAAKATTTSTTVPPTTTSSAAAPVPTTTTTVPPVTTTSTAAPAAPAPTASATASDSGNYTVAVTGTTATITDASGTQTFTGTVGKGAKTVWAKGSETLWIVDGGKVSSVNAATGEQTTVDPNTASVPAEVAALVAE